MAAWALALAALLGAAAAPDRPNILFLTADTLRADALGCYGAAPSPTPRLDRLSADALLFQDCLCAVPLTGPSFGAMLTSVPPRANGATHNALPVSPEFPTVPEALQRAGYFTGCVQSTWTLKAKMAGLHRGFDRYDEDFRRKRWGIVNAERPADEVTDAALRMLEGRPQDRPFFLWVHYIDPHAPYKLHRGFAPPGANVWRLPPREGTRARYWSEAAFMDHHLGRLLDALPPDTVVLFVADHGESLYEHGHLGHGRHVYHDNLRVPLMIRAPGTLPGRSAFPAHGLDIGPTLLALAGLPTLPGMQGLNLLDTEGDGEGRMRFAETYGGAVTRVPGLRQALASGGPTHQTVVEGNWKLILRRGQLPEFYDLGVDPAERSNRFRDSPKEVSRLTGVLKEWTATVGEKAAAPTELTADDRAALEALGYLK